MLPGTWRLFHPKAESSIKCPYGAVSCVGSEASSVNQTSYYLRALLNGTDIGTVTDEIYCNANYSGALCSQSSPGYYIDWVSSESLSCSGGIVSSPLTQSLLLLVPMVFLLPLIICCFVGAKFTPPRKKSRPLSLTKLPSLVRWLQVYKEHDVVTADAPDLPTDDMIADELYSRILTQEDNEQGM